MKDILRLSRRALRVRAVDSAGLKFLAIGVVPFFGSHTLHYPPALPIGLENPGPVGLPALHAPSEAYAFRKGDLLQQLVSDLLRGIPANLNRRIVDHEYLPVHLHLI